MCSNAIKKYNLIKDLAQKNSIININLIEIANYIEEKYIEIPY